MMPARKQEIVNNAVKVGEETKNQIISEAKDSAAKLMQKAQEEIQREKEQALAEIRNEVANLAVLAAGKIIGKTITADDHKSWLTNTSKGGRYSMIDKTIARRYAQAIFDIAREKTR